MPRHRHQPSRSTFPTSEPNSARPDIRTPKPEMSIDEIISFLDKEEFEEAFELMDSAPKWM
jgi:hypothetical protein